MNLKYIQYEENRKIFYFFNTETYDVIEIKSKEDVRLPGYATKQIPEIIDYLNEKMPFDFKVSFTNLTTSEIIKIIQNNRIKDIKIEDNLIIVDTKYSVLDTFPIKRFLLQLYFESTVKE